MTSLRITSEVQKYFFSKEPEVSFYVADSRFFVPEKPIHLIVTSPPYFNYKDYGIEEGIGSEQNYEEYLHNLSVVFNNCYKALVPGGTVCVVIANMKSRKNVEKKSFLYPIVADFIKLMQKIGFVFFDEIIWVKGWGNNGALKGKPLFGSYPYPPTPKILDSIFENILIFKKEGKREVPREIKEKSKLDKNTWLEYTRGVWMIEPDRKAKHPATFPLEIPKRLIALYSFVGDTVYDPFAGTGTTLIASYFLKRNAIGVEVNPKFLEEFKEKWKSFVGSLWSSKDFYKQESKEKLHADESS